MNLRIANEKLKKLNTDIYSPQENETNSSKENVDYYLDESRTFINNSMQQSRNPFNNNTSVFSDKQMADELENFIRTFNI